MIYLGNLSVEQIEREYDVVFSKEDKQWLNEHHQDLAENIKKDKYHFFDIPRIMVAGSAEFAEELCHRLLKYQFSGQFRIGVEK